MILKKLLQLWDNFNIVSIVKVWKSEEVIKKYPIKNIWEWKYTGTAVVPGVITSRIKLNDIEKDPWSREFNTKNWTIDQMGLLVYGSVQVEGKLVRLWSCV
jgi:hypothetical protein